MFKTHPEMSRSYRIVADCFMSLTFLWLLQSAFSDDNHKATPGGSFSEGLFASSLSLSSNVYYHGPRDVKKIALTIDDGWVNDQPLLNLLVSYGITCTVFIPGIVAEKKPDFIRSLDALGFEVCNHSYSHRILTGLSSEEILKEIRDGQAAITKITGKRYPYFRPSGGKINDKVLAAAASEGYAVILWDSDALGYWPDRPLETQLDNLRTHLMNGNIILSHFGAKLRTCEVLQIFIPECLKQGYSFVTVTELLSVSKDAFSTR